MFFDKPLHLLLWHTDRSRHMHVAVLHYAHRQPAGPPVCYQYLTIHAMKSKVLHILMLHKLWSIFYLHGSLNLAPAIAWTQLLNPLKIIRVIDWCPYTSGVSALLTYLFYILSRHVISYQDARRRKVLEPCFDEVTARFVIWASEGAVGAAHLWNAVAVFLDFTLQTFRAEIRADF